METNKHYFVETNFNKEKNLKEEILKKLKLYHQTSRKNWKKIQKIGSILSERELLKRGLVTVEQLNDFETTNNSESDRKFERDDYVFASHIPGDYGDVTLEISLDALEIKGSKIALAGDWAYFSESLEDVKYFFNSEIKASEFINHLSYFLKKLPDQDWFWRKKGNSSEFNAFLRQALKENTTGNSSKLRELKALSPEIMFPRELPLKFIKNVTFSE
jgi:hypothetical protein